MAISTEPCIWRWVGNRTVWRRLQERLQSRLLRMEQSVIVRTIVARESSALSVAGRRSTRGCGCGDGDHPRCFLQSGLVRTGRDGRQ